ncbi:hypothetical protein GGI12_002051 [Dipsacomyces acuminosporus]|nr:hypothetical protein GGI12_002051 [Dipsacomyces acuminosporus]
MSLINLFSTSSTSEDATKTKLRPVTRDRTWINAVHFSDTFTSELPGDKVVSESPFSSIGHEDQEPIADTPEAKFRASRKVSNALWSWTVPNHHEKPKLVGVSDSGAQLIGLDKKLFWDNAESAADVWSGNKVLPGSKPWAHCYGGHQFGVWAEQLGDGRAISLGEVLANEGKDRWELQLKGAGRTPYSRFADGYAVRRSSIREYLAAEHLHALGIPTSRSLSLVFTERPVYREEVELGAVVTRIAPSWVRFGSFELPASRKDYKLVRELADYLIKLAGPISVLIDEGHKTDWSESDDTESVDVNDVKDSTIETVKRILNAFAGEYAKLYAVEMRAKLGLLKKSSETDLASVIQPFLDLLERAKTDYTFALRSLCDVPQMLAGSEIDSEALNAHIDTLMERSQKLLCDDIEQWKRDVYAYYTGVYRDRLVDDIGELTKDAAAKIGAQMKLRNPKYVLRNWVAQDVIEQADKGNTQVIDQVLDLITKHAFDDDVPGFAGAERYAGTVPSWGEGLQCSCSS